ncbi:MAG: hypothetical protein ACI4O7_06215, partial [Aristaeellaceae bacterium]
MVVTSLPIQRPTPFLPSITAILLHSPKGAQQAEESIIPPAFRHTGAIPVMRDADVLRDDHLLLLPTGDGQASAESALRVDRPASSPKKPPCLAAGRLCSAADQNFSGFTRTEGPMVLLR